MKTQSLKDILCLLSFLRPVSGWVAGSVLLGSAAVFAGIGLLGSSAFLIASAALHPSVAALEVAIVGVRFFGIARAGLRYAERLVSHSVNFRVLARLRIWFYTALEPLAPARLQDTRSGDLLARSIGDIQTLENFYVRAVAPPLSALIVISGVLLFVGRFDSTLVLLLLLAFLITGVGLPVLALLLARAPGKELVDRTAVQNTGMVDFVQGMNDLVAYGQAEAALQRILTGASAIGRVQCQLGRISAAMNGLSILLTGLAVWGVLWVGIPLVGSRMDGISLAVVCLVTLASFEAVSPLPQAGQTLSANLTSARRLFEVIDARPQVVSPARPVAEPASADLTIANLTFRYAPDLPTALDHFNLDLPVGKRVVLVGANGAGKTTVLNLLLRFWEIQQGEIRLGGLDLRHYDPETVRHELAVVAQKGYLFAGTLRQNLLLGSPKGEEEALVEAIRQAGLAELVDRLPQGLNTWIGERGVYLSGGEQQRLALARCLLRNSRNPAHRPILVLDEPTAHLDSVSERLFLEDLLRITRGQSLLLITHRLVGLEDMDEIIVLKDGVTLERGKHTELLSRGGTYARMLQIQAEMMTS